MTLNVDDPTDDVLVKLSFYVAEDRLGTEYELEGGRRLTPGPQLRVAAIRRPRLQVQVASARRRTTRGEAVCYGSEGRLVDQRCVLSRRSTYIRLCHLRLSSTLGSHNVNSPPLRPRFDNPQKVSRAKCRNSTLHSSGPSRDIREFTSSQILVIIEGLTH